MKRWEAGEVSRSSSPVTALHTQSSAWALFTKEPLQDF